MLPTNPIAISDDEQFIVGESNLRYFYDQPHRCEGGVIILCLKGSARTTINTNSDQVKSGFSILLLPGSSIMISEASENFNTVFCAFSREILSEVGFRLAPTFFHFLSENPVFECDKSMMIAAKHWMQVTMYTYNNRENIFRNTIFRNRLQNIFLDLYDKIQRSKHFVETELSNRQLEIFNRFIILLYEHNSRERNVAFYADKLCISTRYLLAVVRNISHNTAKKIIDKSVIVEIKQLLQSTDLSVQEIAYRLHFLDQSYISRFFKKHTGEFPTQYRSNIAIKK